jgi:predicted alpha/beta-hydrolase family hydrolase
MTAGVTDYLWTGPQRGFDRAVLLAHGAGAGMDAPALARFAEALAAAGVPSLRFHYPYRSAGRRAPDRAPVLAAATRQAAAELVRRAKLPPERVVLGGRSMGGRYCSLLAADPDDPFPGLGLVLLGYPLHPPGKPDRARSEHFPRLRLPVLFVSGDRDTLARADLLEEHARLIPGPVTLHWVPTADHGFRPLRREGHTFDGVLDDAAAETVTWVRAL